MILPRATTLRARLLAVVLIAVLPAAAFLVHSAREARRAAVDDAKESLVRLARLAAEGPHAFIDGSRVFLEALARTSEIQGADAAAASAWLAMQLSLHPEYTNLILADGEGRVIAGALPASERFNLGGQEWFQRAVQTRAFVLGGYQVGPITGKPVIFCAQPLRGPSGEVERVIHASLSLEILDRIGARVELQPGASLIFMDGKGTILTHFPEPERWRGRVLADEPIVRGILALRKGFEEAPGLDGVVRNYAFTPIGPEWATPLHVAVGMRSEAIVAKADAISRRSLLVLGLVAAAAVAAAWLWGERSIVRPLGRVARAARRLARGDLGTRCGDVGGAVEIRSVARAFDDMAASLEARHADAEEARRVIAEHEELLSAIIDAEPEGVTLLDGEGRVLQMNRAGLALLEADTAEEVLGKGVLHVVRPEHHGAFEDGVRAVRQGQAVTLEVEIEGLKGTRRWVETHAVPLRDADGGVKSLVSVTRDVTARREYTAELERRVAERTARLEETNANLDAFAHTVSHDLQAPLRAMYGFAEALLEDFGDKLEPAGREYAQRIVLASHRMADLIADLLAYSRLVRAEIALQPLDLEAVVADALVQVEAQVKARGATVAVERPLPSVIGHRATLTQVISNLLANAVKFVAPGIVPDVRVRAEVHDGRARLWVEDNGIGIAPEHHERIFQVFERLHGVEAYPGTGIGLSLARKGMERMAGRSGVESAIGQGSRFWIELASAREA